MKMLICLTIGLIVYAGFVVIVGRFCGLSNDEKNSDL